MANQLLKMKRVAKQEREEKMKMQQQAMQAQQQLKSQEMAGQMAMQKNQQEIQGKMQLKQAEVAFDIEKMNNEAQLKAQLMETEFNYQMRLQGVSEESLQVREGEREQAKSNRISQQNTEQSRLINQRKNNLPPQTFESNEDSLDGFDLCLLYTSDAADE